MGAFTGLTQQENRSACDDFAAVTNKGFEHLLKIENARLAVDQCYHVNTKYILHLGLLVQVVKNNLTYFTALNFDNNAHAVFVGLITQLGDTF